MTRRVIFPPTDYWTQPTENTMTNPAAGDCRRAMALIGHHNAGPDFDGINHIIGEANDAGRGTHLFLALLDAYQHIVPQLRTKDAVACLTDAVNLIAEQHASEDWRRAATAIISHSTENVDRLNEVTIEATEQQRTGMLLLAILDLYGYLLPELGTPLGCEAVSRWTATLFGKETGA